MKFTEVLSEISGAEGHCMSVGNGWRDSYFTHLEKQAAIICQKVREKPELQDGYNIVGLSQGSMIARAVIEWCPGGPPVYNFVSLGGPHAGIAAVPLCVVDQCSDWTICVHTNCSESSGTKWIHENPY